MGLAPDSPDSPADALLSPEFIQGVSQFSVKGDKESKLRCKSRLALFNPGTPAVADLLSFPAVAFRIYDMDNDGFISNGELFQVLKMMVGNNLKDTQLQQIVDKTICFADKDEDGKISFEEFCTVSPLLQSCAVASRSAEAPQVVGNTDIHKKMVVDV